MNADYIGLDLGTGTLKGVRWNPKDGVIAQAKTPVHFLHPTASSTEIDAAEYFAQVRGMLNDLADARPGAIAAIAFAAASGNTLLCDKNGQPLTPIISWLDARMDWMPPEDWRVFEVTGWPAMKLFPLAHLEYFRRTQPELLASSQFAMSNDWLAWRLTGIHKMDYSSAVPSELMNRHTRQWHKDYLDYYGLKESQLPELVPSGTVIGKILPEYCHAGITTSTKLVAGSFDHPSAARAVGITKPGEILLSCGTSWVVFQPISEDTPVVPGELYDPYQSANGGYGAKMYSLTAVGVEIEAFVKKHYGDAPDAYEQFNRDPEARPMMQEIVRRVSQRIQQEKPTRIVVTGGPSEGAAWRELLTAELPMIEFAPLRSYTGAAGAAMLATLDN